MFVETCPPVASTVVQASSGVAPPVLSVQTPKGRVQTSSTRLGQNPTNVSWTVKTLVTFAQRSIPSASHAKPATLGPAPQQDQLADSVLLAKEKKKTLSTRAFNQPQIRVPPSAKEDATPVMEQRQSALIARQDTDGQELLVKYVLMTSAKEQILRINSSRELEPTLAEYRATPTVMYARMSKPPVSTAKQDTSGVPTLGHRFVNYVLERPAKVRTL